MIETSNFFSHGSRVIIFSSTLNTNRLGDRCGYRQSARRASGILISCQERSSCWRQAKSDLFQSSLQLQKHVGMFVLPETALFLSQ